MINKNLRATTPINHLNTTNAHAYAGVSLVAFAVDMFSG